MYNKVILENGGMLTFLDWTFLGLPTDGRCKKASHP